MGAAERGEDWGSNYCEALWLDRWGRAPGVLFVIQPHVVSADGKRAVQVGNLVVCEQSGARSLQQAPIQFLATAN